MSSSARFKFILYVNFTYTCLRRKKEKEKLLYLYLNAAMTWIKLVQIKWRVTLERFNCTLIPTTGCSYLSIHLLHFFHLQRKVVYINPDVALCIKERFPVSSSQWRLQFVNYIYCGRYPQLRYRYWIATGGKKLYWCIPNRNPTL